MSERFDISIAEWNGKYDVKVCAGRREVERVVPPAGKEYAFDIQHWARTVNVYVSPTGRSVRVWVDGKEVGPWDRYR